jgi:hypothetical protein
MALLRVTWPGWKVRWASTGLRDVVAELGVDERLVAACDEFEPVPVGWETSTASPPGEAITAVTLVRDGTVDVFAVDWLLPDLVAAGHPEHEARERRGHRVSTWCRVHGRGRGAHP